VCLRGGGVAEAGDAVAPALADRVMNPSARRPSSLASRFGLSETEFVIPGRPIPRIARRVNLDQSVVILCTCFLTVLNLICDEGLRATLPGLAHLKARLEALAGRYEL
jgi:hypothetical protein